jgi:hypothetical protein
VSRSTIVLFLIGTLSSTVLASDPDSKQIDRSELREAAERYARDNAGFIPDLRQPQDEFSGYTARSGRAINRCTECERDRYGRIRRSSTGRADFRRENPCPATSRTTGACPGYVIDQIVPLKRGGADTAENLQWQTKSEAAAKDRWE